MLIIFPSDARKALNFALHTTPISFGDFHSFLTGAFLEFFHASPWFVTGYSLIVGYILGHVIAAISSYFLERILVEKWLGWPAANLLLPDPANNPICFRKYRRSYDKAFITKFNQHFTNYFKLPPSNSSEAFWLSFVFVGQNCPVTFARSIHFLNLYGFSRNLSMAFVLAAVSIFGYEIIYGFHLAWIVIITYLILAALLFWNYLKLLKRLNDEIFRGFYTFVVARRRGA